MAGDAGLTRDRRLEDILGWIADTSDVIPWEPDPRRPVIVHGFRGDDPSRPSD